MKEHFANLGLNSNAPVSTTGTQYHSKYVLSIWLGSICVKKIKHVIKRITFLTTTKRMSEPQIYEAPYNVYILRK